MKKQRTRKTLNSNNKNSFHKTLKACLVHISENYFLFSKIRRIRKTTKTRLNLSFFFLKKHGPQKTLNLENKNNFQKHEPNMSLVFFEFSVFCILCFSKKKKLEIKRVFLIFLVFGHVQFLFLKTVIENSF